jgi:hypothetical protein
MDSEVLQKAIVEPEPAEHEPAERTPYTSPALTEYGRVQDLTQGVGGVQTDAPLSGSHPL